MTAATEKNSRNHTCKSCTSSQLFSLNLNPKRIRRSNSYPFDSSKDLPTHAEKERTRNISTGIIKRWHSIPSVYLDVNDYSTKERSDSNVRYV